MVHKIEKIILLIYSNYFQEIKNRASIVQLLSGIISFSFLNGSKEYIVRTWPCEISALEDY